MPDPQIEGLPDGAIVKPIAGLPDGAVVRPMGNFNHVAAAPKEQEPDALQGFINNTSPDKPIQQEEGMPGWLKPVDEQVQKFGRGALNTGAQMIRHPIDTIGSAVTGALRASPPGNVIDQLRGHPTVGQEIGQSFKANPADTLGGIAIQGLAGEGIGAAAEGIRNAAPKVSQYMRPSPSPSIVDPAEMAARKLGQAVLPATKDASNFIQAAPLEVPNIRDYASRTGNKLNTQLEFSKAAQGSAKEARDFYENQVLKPNDKLVDTTGTGFGDRSGEGPRTSAKLSDIDQRVTEINKQLDKPSLNADDARRALASKTELQAEASKLRDILHKNLSQSTGLAPEDIQNLRQRVGRSYELGNDTDAAVTARMQAEGKTDQGPLALHQIPARILEAVRGGPTAIADRQFQRAIKNFPGESQPLPTVKSPAQEPAVPLRPSLAQQAGITVGERPLAIENLPKTEQDAYLRQYQENRTAGAQRAQQRNISDQRLNDQMQKMNQPIEDIKAANLRRRIQSVYRPGESQ